jgi:hypothetical protein
MLIDAVNADKELDELGNASEAIADDTTNNQNDNSKPTRSRLRVRVCLWRTQMTTIKVGNI